MSGVTKVLVHEFVTGGGLTGQDLPPTWAAEGAAMRRAIAADFARVPGVAVVVTIDGRLDPGPAPPHVDHLIHTEPGLGPLVRQADWVVLIAPETDGILADQTRAIKAAGGRSLGSSAEAITLVGDKLRMAAHLDGRGIPTPPTRPLDPGGFPPIEWAGPWLVKPRDGAGSIATFVIRDRDAIPAEFQRTGPFLIQPYHAGEPMSASFLVDRDGEPTLLAVGRQRVEVDAGGRVRYRGGTIPAGPAECPAAVVAAVASVPGLRGFVGVDFLLDEAGSAVVLEINPRPTTSYVGLGRLVPPGTIAGAWLAAVVGGLAGTEWPDRLRSLRRANPVSFRADGSLGTESTS